MSYQVIYTPEFKRAYKKLSKGLQILFKQKAILFLSDPFSPALKAHKLSGKLHGLWAFTVDQRNRVIFEFLKNETIVLHLIGDHSIYKKR